MTEEERRKEERRQERWVELRADCTEQGIFDLIADTVERDVERFNKLPPHKRRNQKFKFTRDERQSVYVAEVDDSGELINDRPGINIEKGASTIRVWRKQQCQFSIDQEWNDKTLACDLKIDGQCYSVWQISQKAIGNLLFGYD